jgi:hypothetical protein
VTGDKAEEGRGMATYTIELSEDHAKRAERLAVFFKISVETMLKECAELGMEGKEILMENMQWDPGGDPYKGALRRRAAEIEELKRRGLWQV